MENLEHIPLPPYTIIDSSRCFNTVYGEIYDIRAHARRAIVIPTKNEGTRPNEITYLQRRLQSLEPSLGRMLNTVVIISDCESTDDTQRVWRAWVDANPRVASFFMQTAIPKEYNGAALARNNGALAARNRANLELEGTYIFLDADGDFEHRENALPYMLEEMQDNKWRFASPLIGLGYEDDKVDRHWPERVTNLIQVGCERTRKPFTYGGNLLVNTSAFLQVGGFPAEKAKTEVAEDLKLGENLALTYGKNLGGIVYDGGKATFSNRRENRMRREAEQQTRTKLQHHYDAAIRTAKNEGQAALLRAKIESEVKKAGNAAVRRFSLNFGWAVAQHIAGVSHIKAPQSHAEFATTSK